MIEFKDNFSIQSDIYLKYRPHYPKELFLFLSSLTKEHNSAWDCGTGNGQAAVGLADFYKKVIATDPSKQQLQNAIPNKKVIYKNEKAEYNSIESDSIDIVTAANSLHWFDFDIFYASVKRVLKKNGVFAAWTYGPPSVSPEVDNIIKHFHDIILDEYWLSENRLTENEYRTIPFPFQRIGCPDFYCSKEFDLDEMIGYLNTWSAVQRYILNNNKNPADDLFPDLLKVWKDKDFKKVFTWKLVLMTGK